VVGGAGYVADLFVPLLAERHDVRILDPRPRRDGRDQVVGDATDPQALARALPGVDAVVHCAMGADNPTLAAAAQAFDVNVTSVHLTLATAHRFGVRHAVHISSLSVFDDVTGRRVREDDEPDAVDPYGLTKRLGEQVCQAAVRRFGLSVTVLRLAWPTPDDVWPAWGRSDPPRLWYTPDGTPIQGTAGSDVARAVLAALEHRNGFDVFHICGDRSAGLWSTAKARAVLGWAPTYG